MEFLKRIFGICQTRPPNDPASWQVSNRELVIDLKRVPELGNSGNAVRFEGGRLPERILVVRGDDNQFYAFRNRCTHMGRRIDPLVGTDWIRCCSLSKSTFTTDGQVVSGPARGPLTTFETRVQGEQLVIDLKLS